MLQRENSYGLMVTQQTVLTLEINISQYARTISKSNTKGYRIVPYSEQLKYIPIELFQCNCNYNFLSTITNKESMIYINVLELL